MQSNPRQYGFRITLFWQLAISMILLVSLGTGVLWLYIETHLNDLLNQQANTFGTTLANQMAESSAELVLAEDDLALNSMLANLLDQNSYVLLIEILDENEEPIASAYKPLPQPASDQDEYRAAIRFKDVIAGHIRLGLDKSPITKSVHRTIQIMTFLALVTFVILIGLGAMIAKHLTIPLSRLQSVAEDVAQGDLNPTLPTPSNDEVGDLVLSFDKMLQGLRDKESIEDRLSSFISKEVAQGVLANLHESRQPLYKQEGTVLFIDIVSFTALCEKIDEEAVADILNQYYSLAHQAAKMYRGTVDKFIGDGAMITFGISQYDDKHPLNAVCSAHIFYRLIEKMNKQRQKEQLPELGYRIGIHCGEMLAGAIGSDERMEFTVIGDVVNTASRLCDASEINGTLVSDAVINHPSTNGLLDTANPKRILVKGKTEPLESFQVTRLSSKFNRQMLQQQSEVEAMRKPA